MAGRIQILLMLAGAIVINVRADEFSSETSGSWTYTVNQNPAAITKYYENYMKKTEKNLGDLIKHNPALEKFIRKARGLLQMRLLQWVDVIGLMDLMDQQLNKYVTKLQTSGSGAKPGPLAEFAQFIVSHDHTAVTGLMREMRKLIRPLFTSQGVFYLALQFLYRYCIYRHYALHRGTSLERPHSLRTASPLTSRVSQCNSCRVTKRLTSSATMKIAALFALFAFGLATELTQTDLIRQKFYDLEEELWRNVTDPAWRDAGLGGDVELTKAFYRLNDQIEAVPRPKRLTLNSWLWTKVSEKLQIIDGFYKNFIEFVRHQASPGTVPAPVREWLDIAESILMDPKSSVAQAVRKLHGFLEHGDIFRSALQEEDSDVCDLQMSPHQLIYDMYNTIALTEIKGYAMMQFSWMLLRIYGRGNFTQEASLTRQRYAERTGQTATAARAALAMAKRDLYRCDPPVHTSGTYAEVTRLLQGYIENEVDMNTDGTCKENCAFYTLAENHGCYKDLFCAKQEKCSGRILDCQYVDSDMWVCPSSATSQRRYEWIEYENGRTLGRVGSCRHGQTKVDSWWRWLFWHCSYCMCLCDDTTNSDRYFSLREATSDINNNKVVTGMRLVKHGRVFHIQIHQGTLVERGFVESSEEVAAQPFEPGHGSAVEGVDYHTLTYERRAIDLDELDAPAGHVLTGARFRMIGAHLHFEIRVTPFNYTTGRLTPAKSQWISNDNTEGSHMPRTRLELYKPDIPTRAHSTLRIDSQHDQYIEFTHSDFDADAAQSTVPFIDIQPVVPTKALNTKGATLISGAGLYHRGVRGSGGFIAIKLITYDYSKHVKAEPPPMDFIDESETTEFVPVVN